MEKGLAKNLWLKPKDTPLILTENSVHNKEARIKLTEFLFDKLECPAIYICKDSVLSAFACGRSTALVLDSGFQTTTATPVHEGYALQKCIVRHAVGGQSLTRMFEEYLNKNNIQI